MECILLCPSSDLLDSDHQIISTLFDNLHKLSRAEGLPVHSPLCKASAPSKPPPKKGIAKKSAPSKKRKPSKAATSSANKAAAATSASQQASVPPPSQDASDADSVEDENEVYCICRRPDNHTWMIACDGRCEDWYHGRCVQVDEEDEELIDRYICPKCSRREGTDPSAWTVTTWKPMCRRQGCRHPCRLRKGDASKYCSDECGLRFWRDKLEGARQETGERDDNQNRCPERMAEALLVRMQPVMKIARHNPSRCSFSVKHCATVEVR